MVHGEFPLETSLCRVVLQGLVSRIPLFSARTSPADERGANNGPRWSRSEHPEALPQAGGRYPLEWLDASSLVCPSAVYCSNLAVRLTRLIRWISSTPDSSNTRAELCADAIGGARPPESAYVHTMNAERTMQPTTMDYCLRSGGELLPAIRVSRRSKGLRNTHQAWLKQRAATTRGMRRPCRTNCAAANARQTSTIQWRGSLRRSQGGAGFTT